MRPVNMPSKANNHLQPSMPLWPRKRRMPKARNADMICVL